MRSFSHVNDEHVITISSLPSLRRLSVTTDAPDGPIHSLVVDSLTSPLLEAAEDDSDDEPDVQLQASMRLAYNLSWAVNIFLLVGKVYAFWISSSRSVLASAADSAVDLASQVVIVWAEWQMNRVDPRYPVGRARLETIGVLACACIMSVASFAVIETAAMDLWRAFASGILPDAEFGLVMYIVLATATALKLVCWAYCRVFASRSDSMQALAEDHINDVMSNLAAVGAALIAGLAPGAWWADPVGAIIISIWIVWRWYEIAAQQVDKIVGRSAPEEFIRSLTELAMGHHASLVVDVVRAYHFGARYIVELEVVLPAEMTVAVSHDISIALMHKVERLEEVERAFVHVDYLHREAPEHKTERRLAKALGGSGNNIASLASAGSGSLGTLTPTGSGALPVQTPKGGAGARISGTNGV